MTLPLQLGGHFAPVRVFEVSLELIAPAGDHTPIRWTALVAGRPQWRLPFAVVLGQRGWFDQFPTTIDDTFTTVHIERG